MWRGSGGVHEHSTLHTVKSIIKELRKTGKITTYSKTKVSTPWQSVSHDAGAIDMIGSKYAQQLQWKCDKV